MFFHPSLAYPTQQAYSIVKERDKDSFGKEAIETIMKHLDPPTCVFIFAGYQKPMDDFLQVNQGLARRIPYRYNFHAYNDSDLTKIFSVMCDAKAEILGPDVLANFPKLLAQVSPHQRATQNAGRLPLPLVSLLLLPYCSILFFLLPFSM